MTMFKRGRVNRSKITRDKRGLSLIEIVVTLALFSLIAVSVSGFIIISAKTFTKVNNDINLQYEAQLTAARLREYLVDANGGVAFDNDTLYIIDKSTTEDNNGKTETVYTAYSFSFDSTASKIYYRTAPILYDETIPGFVCNISNAEKHAVGDNVSDFAIMMSNMGKSTTADITIVLKQSGKSYTENQITGIRNTVVISGNFDSLINSVCKRVIAVVTSTESTTTAEE